MPLLERPSRHAVRGRGRRALAAVAVLPMAIAALLSVGGAPARAAGSDVIAVDDLGEGEAGQYVDVTFDRCPRVSAPAVEVLVNGESSQGRQYALSGRLGKGRTLTFLVHAGSYTASFFTAGQTAPFATAPVTAREAGAVEKVRLSALCSTATATTTATTTATAAAVTTTHGRSVQVADRSGPAAREGLPGWVLPTGLGATVVALLGWTARNRRMRAGA